jgi:hypothetical protein
MTLELKMLALSIVLGMVQIVLASHAASLQPAMSGRWYAFDACFWHLAEIDQCADECPLLAARPTLNYQSRFMSTRPRKVSA